MRKTKLPPHPALPAVPTRDAVRTPLFWLLYEHHKAFAESWRGHRVKWPTVCAWAAAHGVRDQQGNALPPGTVKKTWARVRAVVEQEKAERDAKPRPAHLRSPAISQPPPVAAPVTNPPTRSQPTPAQADAGQAFDADAYIAEMRADLAHRSGRR